MTKKTHVAVGTALTLPIISAYSPVLILGLLGAVIPDWDYKIGLDHRKITHSLIALIVSSIIVSMFNYKVGIVWLISYSSHLILDSFTKMGVPVFYPWNKKYYGLKLIRTGGAEDLFICLLAIFFICIKYK